jgi:hypothetical protein
MPCISLWQPWAQLIVLGAKKYETRDWIAPQQFRGRIAIHAAKTTKDRINKVDLCEYCFLPHFYEFVPVFEELPLGAVVGTVELTHCYRVEDVRPHLSDQELAFGNYEDGRFCWRMKDPVIFKEPIPLRGLQKFFTIDLADELLGVRVA